MAKKRKHALLSASGAVQWIHCTPSAKLCDELPDTESSYTKEGTLAHEICELKLTADSLKTGTYTRRMNKIKKNELYQEETVWKDKLTNALKQVQAPQEEFFRLGL